MKQSLMGTGEEGTPPKPSKPASSTQVSPSSSSLSPFLLFSLSLFVCFFFFLFIGFKAFSIDLQEMPTTPYADWSSSMQVLDENIFNVFDCFVLLWIFYYFI